MQIIKFTNSTLKIPQGAHIGTLIQIIDLGLQPEYVYKGKRCPKAPRVAFNFEFPNIKNQEGKPISNLFTLFFSEHAGSKLNLYANALLGGTEEVAKMLEQELNFLDLLGKSAQLQIGKNENDTSIIVAMMALPAGLPHPKPSVTPTFFDMDNPDIALFESFKPFLQNKILEAENVHPLLKSKEHKMSTVPPVTRATAPNAEHF